MNINKVVVAGNLTRDVELRYTPKGAAVAKCGVAVNRRWKGEDGEMKEEVTFVDVTFWGSTAEAVGQYLSKGKPIYIEGRLKLDSWEDKNGGGTRQKLSVVAESFQFVGRKDEGGEAGQRTGGGERRGKTNASPQSAPVAGDEPPDDDSDVPF